MSHSIKFARLFFNFLLAVGLSLVVVASATGEQITGAQVEGDGQWIDTLTSLRSLTTLVKSTKMIQSCVEGECLDRESTLQVSILVIDNGPSTDVSSPAALYLAMYNSVEETAVAKSVHLIEDIVEFRGARRIEAGIYEIDYQAFRLEDECAYPNVKATIDARILSAKVRAAKKIGFLEDFVYTDAIEVEYTTISCPKT